MVTCRSIVVEAGLEGGGETDIVVVDEEGAWSRRVGLRSGFEVRCESSRWRTLACLVSQSNLVLSYRSSEV